MKYPTEINQYFQSPEVAGIAAEIIYLIYAETQQDRGFDAVWLYDIAKEKPEIYRNLSKLTQQQFLWRLAMCLRTLGGWEKQSKNSHYYWKVRPHKPKMHFIPPAWFKEWESCPVPIFLALRKPDRTIQKSILDFILRL